MSVETELCLLPSTTENGENLQTSRDTKLIAAVWTVKPELSIPRSLATRHAVLPGGIDARKLLLQSLVSSLGKTSKNSEAEKQCRDDEKG